MAEKKKKTFEELKSDFQGKTIKEKLDELFDMQLAQNNVLNQIGMGLQKLGQGINYVAKSVDERGIRPDKKLKKVK